MSELIYWEMQDSDMMLNVMYTSRWAKEKYFT